MAFMAIVRVEGNRVAKYAIFEREKDAEEHVARHGGFVYETDSRPDVLYIGDKNEVSVVPQDEPVPQTVTAYQARIALLSAGLLPTVEALMSDERTDAAARIAWEYATVFERESAFIRALAPSLSLSEEQLDHLFISASKVS